jgi:hypothetical protein
MQFMLTDWLAEEQADPKPHPVAITNRYGLKVTEIPPQATLDRLDTLANAWCARYGATRTDDWKVVERSLCLAVRSHCGKGVFISPLVLCGFARDGKAYGEVLTVEPSLNNWQCDREIALPRERSM